MRVYRVRVRLPLPKCILASHRAMEIFVLGYRFQNLPEQIIKLNHKMLKFGDCFCVTAVALYTVTPTNFKLTESNKLWISRKKKVAITIRSEIDTDL